MMMKCVFLLQVMLCDSSEKLLECRLLKSDEVVRCGETLMFNAYLVDVGDLEGGDRPFNGVTSYSCFTNIDGIQNPHDRIISSTVFDIPLLYFSINFP